jgi:hypothetical protein
MASSKFDGSGNVQSGRDPRETISDELPLLREVEERRGERRHVLKNHLMNPSLRLSPRFPPCLAGRETRFEAVD